MGIRAEKTSGSVRTQHAAQGRRLRCLLVSLSLPLWACQGAAQTDSVPVTQAPASVADARAHHAADGFRNPYLVGEHSSLLDYVWMRMTDDAPYADQSTQTDQIRVAPSTPPLTGFTDRPQLTWLGHSTFLIRHQGKALLTDPILSDRASPVSFAGPRRLAPLPYTLADLPPIDWVVISHNHYDHLDLDTIQALGNGPRYAVPLGLRQWFVDKGIDADRVVEFDWWDSRELDGARITATPSQHWSARSAFDRMETLWAAWRIDLPGFRIWFGGDTGYNDVQFKQTGERLGPVDLALIPIGSYAPRWFMKNSHVNPEEAIAIHHDVRSHFSVGMHWSTFQLSGEPLDEPRQRLEERVAAGALKQGQFITLAIGETREIEAVSTAP